MNLNKKKYFRIIAGTGILLILVSGLIFFTSILINQDFIIRKIQSTISRRVGGEVSFQKVDLSFFLRPHIQFQQCGFSLPGKAAGTVGSLIVYPEWFHLLKGEFRIHKINAETPDIKIMLPEQTSKEEKGLETFSFKAIEKKTVSILGLLMSKAPNFVICVENGRLNLAKEKKTAFWYRDIQASIDLQSDKINIDIHCISNFAKRINLKGSVDPKDLGIRGKIDLSGFNPQVLSGHLFPDTAIRLGASQLSLTLNFTADNFKSLSGKLQGRIPLLTVFRKNKKVVIQGQDLNGHFHVGAGKASVFLERLVLDNPQLHLAGKLLVGPNKPHISLEIEGKEIGVHSTRESVLALAEEIPVIRKIFSIVRGGKVPAVTIKTCGTSAKDLGNLENLTILGRMLDGKIFVPGAELNLTDVRGEAFISQGLLEGKNLEARMEESLGHKGILKMGLGEKNSSFHLDIVIRTALSHLPPLLKRFVRNKTFVEEIDRTSDIKGTAEGRLILGDRIDSLKAIVDVSKLNLSAHYQRIPYPLEINGGHLVINEAGIDINNVTGKLGKSFVSQLSAGLRWEKEFFLKAESGKSKIFLEEIYPWLSSYKSIGDCLKKIKIMKGEVTFSSVKLKGPLLKPEKWHFETRGEAQHLAVYTSLFSEPIKIVGGSFHAIEDRINQKVSFKDTRITMLDASLKTSGVLYECLAGINRADINVQGDLQSASIQWFSKLIHLPVLFVPGSPLSLSQGRLQWNKTAETSFAGDLVVKKGPAVSMAIIKKPKELMIKQLLIQDQKACATLKMSIHKKAFGFEFDGFATEKTLDRLFKKNQILRGWIKGTFQAHIVPGNCKQSKVYGKLQGKDLIIPWDMEAPVKIDNFDLEAENNGVKVKSVIVTLTNDTVTTQGDMLFAEDGLQLDMNLSARHFNWKTIRNLLGKNSKEQDAKQAFSLLALPLKGRLRFRSEHFTYDRFVWTPLSADIFLTQKEIDIKISEAELCGISTPGTLKIKPRDITLDFKSDSSNQQLEATLACLLDTKRQITGLFDFKGELTARGKPEKLIKSLKGNLDLTAKNGRIYRYGLLAKVLAFLNITEVFKRNFPDFTKEGFAYDALTAQAIIKDGKLVIKKGFINSPSMEIACQGDYDLADQKVDLVFLVAPLKTVDFMVKKIPVINEILDGTLVSIPVKVTGEVNNPHIFYMSPTAVGSGMLEMMKRILQVPIKIIKPALPDKNNQ